MKSEFRKRLVLLVFIVCAPLCATAQASGFATPQQAVKALEKAYANNDLEAAVKAKDFQQEAKLMLVSINPDFAEMTDIVAETAEVLELGFRKEVSNNAFSIFKGAKCKLSKPKKVAENLVKMQERCTFANGQQSRDELHAYKGKDGWKVVTVP